MSNVFLSSFMTFKHISIFLSRGNMMNYWLILMFQFELNRYCKHKLFEKTKFYYPCLVGSDGTPKRRKFLTLDQKIEIIECYEAGTKCATIAKMRGMSDSSVRTIIKEKDKIKDQAQASHLPLNAVVRKNTIRIKLFIN